MRLIFRVRMFVLVRMLMFVSVRSIVLGMLVRRALMLVLMRRLRMGLRQAIAFQDMDLGACDPTAVHALDAKTCSQAKRVDGIHQHLRRNPGIDQGAQQHVARDAGKTVKICNAHETLFPGTLSCSGGL
jgi:hypothetical protein